MLAFDNDIGCEEAVWADGMLCWIVWTDNSVGDDGMKVLCEVLEENTTLTKVNVECLLWMVLLRMAQMDEMDE